MCARACTCICTYIYIYAYICIYIYIYVYVLYVYIYIYTYICIYAHQVKEAFEAAPPVRPEALWQLLEGLLEALEDPSWRAPGP